MGTALRRRFGVWAVLAMIVTEVMGGALPILVFPVLVVVIVGLFATGSPVPTFIGAAVIALGIPASFFVVKGPRPVKA